LFGKSTGGSNLFGSTNENKKEPEPSKTPFAFGKKVESQP